jgi:hypothetical protein
MVSKNSNSFEVSKDYQPKFANLKDASAQVKSLLPEMVGEEKKSDFSTQALLVAYTDLVFHQASKTANKNKIPSYDTCKSDFKAWVAESTDEKNIQSRLQRRCEFVVKGALLCHAVPNAFTIGYHLKEDKNFCSPDARVGKPSSYDERYTQSLFWSRAEIFEKEQIDKKTIVDSRRDWVQPIQSEVDDAFKYVFGNAVISANKTGLEKEERVKDEERNYSLKGSKEILRTVDGLIAHLKKSEDNALGLMSESDAHKAKVSFKTLANLLVKAIKDEEVNNQVYADYSDDKIKTKKVA